jgi:hypothetical protein
VVSVATVLTATLAHLVEQVQLGGLLHGQQTTNRLSGGLAFGRHLLSHRTGLQHQSTESFGVRALGGLEFPDLSMDLSGLLATRLPCFARRFHDLPHGGPLALSEIQSLQDPETAMARSRVVTMAPLSTTAMVGIGMFARLGNSDSRGYCKASSGDGT